MARSFANTSGKRSAICIDELLNPYTPVTPPNHHEALVMRPAPQAPPSSTPRTPPSAVAAEQCPAYAASSTTTNDVAVSSQAVPRGLTSRNRYASPTTTSGSRAIPDRDSRTAGLAAASANTVSYIFTVDDHSIDGIDIVHPKEWGCAEAVRTVPGRGDWTSFVFTRFRFAVHVAVAAQSIGTLVHGCSFYPGPTQGWMKVSCELVVDDDVVMVAVPCCLVDFVRGPPAWGYWGW